MQPAVSSPSASTVAWPGQPWMKIPFWPQIIRKTVTNDKDTVRFTEHTFRLIPHLGNMRIPIVLLVLAREEVTIERRMTLDKFLNWRCEFGVKIKDGRIRRYGEPPKQEGSYQSAHL